MRPVRLLVLLASLALLGACTSSDVSYADGSEPETGIGGGDAISVGDGETGGGGSDLGGGGSDGLTPGGNFQDPCTGDGDCLSGYCVNVRSGYVCTQLCADDSGCPEGWSCRTLVNSGGDIVELCTPDVSALCASCTTNEECGVIGDLCYNLDGTSYCGQQCEYQRDCPEGYLCQEVSDVAGGVTAQQCVPDTGRCSCRPEQDGESRPCVQSNAWGACEGIQVCEGFSGWSACTANVPEEEICDGADNDCDGVVDEDMAPRPCTSTPNAYGVCEGSETCQGISGWVCDAPLASIEICDGIDNDCNGTIDDGLCYDGNPCIADVCDAGTGECAYPPRAGECDDGDACTTGDRCIESSCRGEPMDCDDGNPCTNDTCNPVMGCQWANADGAPCETGNLCTNDTCRGGSCTTGGAISCPNGQCQSSRCDPATGCVTDNLSGVPCSDGDDCTVGDTCSAGSCIEGRSYCEGRGCSNCSGDWLTLGGWCEEIFGSPVCLCFCI